MPNLSIIIVSYNTLQVTKDCLDSLVNSLKQTPSVNAEIIIVDNNSQDGSSNMLHNFEKKHDTGKGILRVKVIKNSSNLGFSKANNEGLAATNGKYILFLNSDVIVTDVNFVDVIEYMNKNQKVGILTVDVRLQDGKRDMASHRGFPTPWNSFTYFTRLEKLSSKMPKIKKLFGGYHMTHLDLNTIHEIDSPSGAFYFTRKSVLNQVGGFDPSFFMYGEDLDLSYRIKKHGYKAIYYPLFRVLHMKYQSGIKHGKKGLQTSTKHHFYDAMKIFYDKHSGEKNGSLKKKLVHLFIDLKRKTAT